MYFVLRKITIIHLSHLIISCMQKKIILISLINHQILRTNQLNIGKEILLMSIRQILLMILLF